MNYTKITCRLGSSKIRYDELSQKEINMSNSKMGNMFEKLKVAIRYGEELVKAERHPVGEVNVPKDIGVYLWRSKKDGQIVYIGQALGRGGLYQRINQQHLNERYRRKDVEKSAFRRNVAEEYKNLKWEEVVPFIIKNYTLSFITFPKENERLVNFVEKLLQFELEPKYSPYKMTR